MKLAQEHFKDYKFTEAEELLLEKAPKGERADMMPKWLDTSFPHEIKHWLQDRNFPELYRWLESNDYPALKQWLHETDPTYAEAWPESREVRAEIIQWLLLDKDAKEQLKHIGIKLGGARIIGSMDFNYASIEHPVQIIYCSLNELSFLDATTKRLSFLGSHINGFLADNANIKGNAAFERIVSHGRFSLNSAHISRQLQCGGATFDFEGNTSFNADRITVKSSAIFDKIESKGEFRINGANIEGQLLCDHAKFDNQQKGGIDKFSFCADDTTINGGAFFRHATSLGEFRLTGAKISGVLSCEHAIFKNEIGLSFNAKRIVVMDDVFSF